MSLIMSQTQSVLKRLILGASVLGLVSCGYAQVEDFLETDIEPANNFESQLAARYQTIASEYAEKDNWRNAFYLAEKSRRALEGEIPDPENPQERSVLEEKRPEMQQARRTLLSTLRTYSARRPASCAEAQGYYDEWLLQASSNRFGVEGSFFGGRGGPSASAKPEESRESFQNALDKCAGRVMAAELDLDEEQFRGTFGMDLPEIGVRTVYFDFDSDRLDEPSRDIVAEVADMVDQYRSHRVEVTGHTDTAGPVHYNQVLGKRRARNVARALQAAGVSNIVIFSEGETSLAVPTGDDVREPLNRRSEILIKAE